MFVFVLNKCWYDKIVSGEKKIEYRLDKPYWRKRVENALQEYEHISWCDYMNKKVIHEDVEPLHIPCVFSNGYTKEKVKGVVTRLDYSFKECTDLAPDKSDIESCFCFYFELEK